MSESDAGERDDEPTGVLTEVYRSVSPASESRPNAAMDVTGWTIFVVMLALFLPLLPIIVVVWAVSKVFEAVVGRD